MMEAPNLYTRWTRSSERRVTADILSDSVVIQYDNDGARVITRLSSPDGSAVEMDPDMARMIGVRLIEAATRAEGNRRLRDGTT